MMKLFTDNVGAGRGPPRWAPRRPASHGVPAGTLRRPFAIVRAASSGLSFRSAFAALNVPHGTSRAGRAEHERTLAGIARRRELRPRVERVRRANGGRHGRARDAQRRGPRQRSCGRRAARSDVVRVTAPPARRDHGQAARPRQRRPTPEDVRRLVDLRRDDGHLRGPRRRRLLPLSARAVRRRHDLRRTRTSTPRST